MAAIYRNNFKKLIKLHDIESPLYFIRIDNSLSHY